MKLGFYFTTLMLLISAMYVHGQPTQPLISQLKLPQIAPASPDVAAIEKFGNFQVTYSTGVPNISIPLWTIQCGSVSWPFSLSYHASGIKVDESASMVGLGWNLDGPAVITRSVNGRRDEETSSGEPADFSTVTDADYTYLYNANEGIADAELDLFNFSFNGRSGKFVMMHDGAGTILQVPQSNLKITHDPSLDSFTIRDEMGVIYTFKEKEQTITNSPNGTEYYISSWYLTRVETADKNNTIVFTYASAGDVADNYKSYTHTIGRKYYASFDPFVLPSKNNIVENIIESNSGVTIGSKKLTGVAFPNGSITLNYDATPRQDIGSYTVYNRLTSLVINETFNGLTTPVKTFVFNQTYFHYTPSTWTDAMTHYRLRLDNVMEKTTLTGTTLKQHTFQYNLSENMSPRGSRGQDIWGFNNGQTGNASLIPSESVSYFDGEITVTASVGNANRNVDANKMKAWMLTSITYPTGGKTVFDYEPHVYATDFTLSTKKEFVASVIGSQTPPFQDIEGFTFPATNVIKGTTRLLLDMSRIDVAGVSQLTAVVLRDITASQDVFVLSHPQPNQRYAYDLPVELVGGHQYELKATLYYSGVANSQLDAAIRVRWSESTTAPDIRTGGGLRIKEMIHYSDNTTIATKETFSYDTAVTLTPFHLINKRYKEVTYRLGTTSGTGGVVYFPSPVCRVYHGQSIYALSNALGSPMLYSRVEKKNINAATGTPNGKSVFEYDVFQDPTVAVGGPLSLGASWTNGFLKSETHYKYTGSNYVMVQKKENEYGGYGGSRTVGLRVEPKVIVEGSFKPHTASTVFEDLRYYTVDLPTGSKRLTKETVTNVDEFGQNLVTVTTNFYNSPYYDYPTKVAVIDSKNNTDSVTYKRAPDLATGTNSVHDKMKLINMLQPVIEQVSYKNAAKQSTLKNNYRDWFLNSKVIALETVEASYATNALETRVRYLGYDAYNNPLSFSKEADIPTSYIWAYNNTRPIAQVINAAPASIAYTSFETSETGGWSGFTGPGRTLSGSLTGMLAWTQNSFSFSKNGLTNGVTYTVSYWSKNGSYTVNATSGTSGRVVNGWTMYAHSIVPTTGTVTVSGSGSIDELKLYPLGSHMTTYTYKPMTGISSAIDPNNRIQYFEYDELQRLVLVRDQDRNILKKNAYNYNGLTEYPNIYYNTAYNLSKYKQGCTGCQIGSSVTYTVPANSYLSTISATAANSLAQAEATALAQAYANSVGTCSTPSSATVPSDNNVAASFQVKFHNNCTGTNYIYSVVTGASTAALSPAPPNGNYEVTFTQMAGPAGTYTCIVNGQSKNTANPVFPNVDVFITGNTGVVIN